VLTLKGPPQFLAASEKASISRQEIEFNRYIGLLTAGGGLAQAHRNGVSL
jgi:hypothetical protein